MKRFRMVSVLMLVLALIVSGCGSSSSSGPTDTGSSNSSGTSGGSEQQPEVTGTLKIAQQFGINYLPEMVMVHEKMIEKRLPGVTVEFTQLASGGSVTTGMLAGAIDVAIVGIGPALLAAHKDPSIKVAIGGAVSPYRMNSNTDRIQSIADITPEDKIALPSPTSDQSVYLRIAAMKEFGDPNKFDNQMISMPHPVALTALVNRSQDITLHMTSSPYAEKEAASEGIHQVLSSFDVMGGPHVSSPFIASQSFVEEKPEIYAAFLDAVEEAQEFIRENPQEAAEIAREMGLDMPADELEAIVTADYYEWTTELKRIDEIAQYLYEIGLIDEPMSPEDYLWDAK